MTSKSFQEKSYAQHAKEFSKCGLGGDQEGHAKTWFEKGTVDAWRHQRMYQILDPILDTDPDSKWLTVGDGRYGKDARYIIDKGCDALATDISDVLLREASQMGFLAGFKKENAESLSFEDCQFDYVFCKESYHHFPRPMLALYEMLRVSKKGVVLIEPNDSYINNRVTEVFFRNLKNVVKRLLGRKDIKHTYEESGNYVYKISRREVTKVALGLNYRMIAFKGINDIHFAGVEYEKLSEEGPLRTKILRFIWITNLLCRLRLTDYIILAVIIFKHVPSESMLQRLAGAGYEINHLPNNPYITD